jgi:hypothetical protein
MATMFDDVDAKCPYFHSSNKREITCEGITDGCITALKFESQSKRNLHRSVFCDAKYENCEIFRMLEEKYEDE